MAHRPRRTRDPGYADRRAGYAPSLAYRAATPGPAVPPTRTIYTEEEIACFAILAAIESNRSPHEAKVKLCRHFGVNIPAHRTSATTRPEPNGEESDSSLSSASTFSATSSASSASSGTSDTRAGKRRRLSPPAEDASATQAARDTANILLSIPVYTLGINNSGSGSSSSSGGGGGESSVDSGEGGSSEGGEGADDWGEDMWGVCNIWGVWGRRGKGRDRKRRKLQYLDDPIEPRHRR